MIKFTKEFSHYRAKCNKRDSNRYVGSGEYYVRLTDIRQSPIQDFYLEERELIEIVALLETMKKVGHLL